MGSSSPPCNHMLIITQLNPTNTIPEQMLQGHMFDTCTESSNPPTTHHGRRSARMYKLAVQLGSAP